MASQRGVRGALARAGLIRPAHGKVIAGVAAGLARRLGVSPWLVRGVFVVSILLPGPQFLVYAALWIAMPRQG
ncbi:MAG: PspC domain-containing protein [Thermoleophilaceae bacterium]|jgi:phage shock protein PspC (stress-responsive transcriptional regulator)|nr:PspC domain-containing protein [Thermoleophilaceae bacterium]